MEAMSRLKISLLIGLAAVACGPESSPPSAQALPSSAAASPSSSFSEPVLGPRRNQSATGLNAAPQCDPGSEAVVHLSWSPARERGRAQKVAVTQFADGFETDRFTVSPRLAPAASRFDWRGTQANGSYRWRLLTRHGSWVGSRISSFIAPNCGVEDYG